MNDVRSYFARNADSYGRSARIQGRIANELAERALPCDAPVQNILELGAGTGQFTAKLAASYPAADITALEWSEEMSSQQPDDGPNVSWVLGDMNRLSPEMFEGGFDLIASNCVLHWADSIADVLRRSASLLNDTGSISAAIMTRGTLARLHCVRRQIAPNKTPLRQLPSIAEVQRAVKEAELSTQFCAPLHFEESFTSVQAMLEHLRVAAFTGGVFARSETMLTRTELNDLCETYREESLAKASEISAEFECVLLRCAT
jgi:trans-aconitate methyltransferase